MKKPSRQINFELDLVDGWEGLDAIIVLTQVIFT